MYTSRRGSARGYSAYRRVNIVQSDNRIFRAEPRLSVDIISSVVLIPRVEMRCFFFFVFHRKLEKKKNPKRAPVLPGTLRSRLISTIRLYIDVWYTRVWCIRSIMCILTALIIKYSMKKKKQIVSNHVLNKIQRYLVPRTWNYIY